MDWGPLMDLSSDCGTFRGLSPDWEFLIDLSSDWGALMDLSSDWGALMDLSSDWGTTLSTPPPSSNVFLSCPLFTPRSFFYSSLIPRIQLKKILKVCFLLSCWKTALYNFSFIISGDYKEFESLSQTLMFLSLTLGNPML